MAGEKEELVVLEEDKGVTVNFEEDQAAKEPEKKIEKKADDREDAISDLKKQLERQKAEAETEKRARLQAEQLAREQFQAATTAKGEVEDSNLRVIINAIDATEQAAAGAERAYADAMGQNDYVAASKAQRAMAQAEAQLLQLNNGKSALEERLKAQKEQQKSGHQPEIRQIDQNQDPVELLASRLTPKSAEWVRAHPTCIQNVNKLTAAHQSAVELEGIEVESPEYFAYIEQKLGIGHSDRPVQKKSMSSAPVNTASSGGGRQPGNTMTLSASEVEFAIIDSPDLPRDKAIEKYARNKAQLIREGKMQ